MSMQLYKDFKRRTARRWVKKTIYILPPELNQMVMEYADGYPGMKQKLANLHKQIRSPNYLHVYNVLLQFQTPQVTCERLKVDAVCNMIKIDMEDAQDHDLHYVYDFLAYIRHKVSRREVKLIVFKPGDLVAWKIGPDLN